jgi:hypothetical protein
VRFQSNSARRSVAPGSSDHPGGMDDVVAVGPGRSSRFAHGGAVAVESGLMKRSKFACAPADLVSTARSFKRTSARSRCTRPEEIYRGTDSIGIARRLTEKLPW